MSVKTTKDYDQHAHEQPTQASDWAMEHGPENQMGSDTRGRILASLADSSKQYSPDAPPYGGGGKVATYDRDTGSHHRGDTVTDSWSDKTFDRDTAPPLAERPSESYAPPSGWLDRTNRGTDSDPRIDSNVFPSDKE